MLNPFPDLLIFRFLAPTLLRFAAALVFLYGAYYIYRHRKQIAEFPFPVIGKAQWIAWVGFAVHGVLAFMLGAGYYTQWAALIGAVASIKGVLFAKRYGTLFPLSPAAYALLFVILFSLLLSGAGAFAYDLPL